MDDLHDSDSSPVWAIFSDLMAALVGILVLVLVWVIGIQLELSQSLEEEKARRVAEEQRRQALEEALADFEQGVKLTRECQKKLASAEQKVKMLMEENGSIRELPFEADDSTGDL